MNMWYSYFLLQLCITNLFHYIYRGTVMFTYNNRSDAHIFFYSNQFWQQFFPKKKYNFPGTHGCSSIVFIDQ